MAGKPSIRGPLHFVGFTTDAHYWLQTKTKKVFRICFGVFVSLKMFKCISPLWMVEVLGRRYIYINSIPFQKKTHTKHLSTWKEHREISWAMKVPGARCHGLMVNLGSGQIIIFHLSRFPWNLRGFPLLNHHLGAQVVWDRYNLTR